MKKFVSLISFSIIIFSSHSIVMGQFNTPGLPVIDDVYWEAIGPEGGDIRSVAQNPSDLNELYICTWGFPGTVCKSTNYGESWQKVSYVDGLAYAIALDTISTGTIYVTSGNSINKSIDGGLTWDRYYFSEEDTSFSDCSVVINPSNTDIIYTAGFQRRENTIYRATIFKSTDGGVNWQCISLSPELEYAKVLSIAIDPTNPDILYAGMFIIINQSGHCFVIKSYDGGESWTDITGIINQEPAVIIIDPMDAERVYIGSNIFVYRSTDGGSSWTKCEGFAFAEELILDPLDSSKLYGAGMVNFNYSTDYGVTWQAGSQDIEGTAHFLISNGSNNVIYGGSKGVYVSDDLGESWNSINTGLKATIVSTMAVASSSPNKILAEAGDLGLMVSNDYGSSWQMLTGPENCSGYRSLEFEQNDENHIFVLGGP